MIRCVRMWTGEDGNSLFEEGTIELSGEARGDSETPAIAVSELSFRETSSGGSWDWHKICSTLCHHTYWYFRV